MAVNISPSKHIQIQQRNEFKLALAIIENISSQIWPHYINPAWVLDTLSSKHDMVFTDSSLKNLAKCLVGELIIT